MSYVLDIGPNTFNYDYENGYEHTRIESVKLYVDDVLHEEWIATAWSRALRKIVELVTPYIDKNTTAFENNFNRLLKTTINKGNFNYNYCFKPELFTDDSFITSSLYKGNKNHKLKLVTDRDGQEKYICAVYTTEVIWVLGALIRALKDYNIRLLITYDFRKNISTDQDVNDLIINMENKLEKEKDIIKQELESKLQGILFEITDILKQLKTL